MLIQTFTVKGIGQFPYDMLRYDQCWPANESQSPLLNSNPITNSEDYLCKPREVVMKRYVQRKNDLPTIGRWRSYGWTVIEASIQTIKW